MIIATGEDVNLIVGNEIKCSPNIIPTDFCDVWLRVEAVEIGYPFVYFGTELSAVSPSIIIEVR